MLGGAEHLKIDLIRGAIEKANELRAIQCEVLDDEGFEDSTELLGEHLTYFQLRPRLAATTRAWLDDLGARTHFEDLKAEVAAMRTQVEQLQKRLAD